MTCVGEAQTDGPTAADEAAFPSGLLWAMGSPTTGRGPRRRRSVQRREENVPIDDGVIGGLLGEVDLDGEAKGLLVDASDRDVVAGE